MQRLAVVAAMTGGRTAFRWTRCSRQWPASSTSARARSASHSWRRSTRATTSVWRSTTTARPCPTWPSSSAPSWRHTAAPWWKRRSLPRGSRSRSSTSRPSRCLHPSSRGASLRIASASRRRPSLPTSVCRSTKEVSTVLCLCCEHKCNRAVVDIRLHSRPGAAPWWVSLTGWPQTSNTRGFLWTWKTQGILREFCAASGKNFNKVVLVCHSYICVKQLLTG